MTDQASWLTFPAALQQYGLKGANRKTECLIADLEAHILQLGPLRNPSERGVCPGMYAATKLRLAARCSPAVDSQPSDLAASFFITLNVPPEPAPPTKAEMVDQLRKRVEELQEQLEQAQAELALALREDAQPIQQGGRQPSDATATVDRVVEVKPADPSPSSGTPLTPQVRSASTATSTRTADSYWLSSLFSRSISITTQAPPCTPAAPVVTRENVATAPAAEVNQQLPRTIRAPLTPVPCASMRVSVARADQRPATCGGKLGARGGGGCVGTPTGQGWLTLVDVQ